MLVNLFPDIQSVLRQRILQLQKQVRAEIRRFLSIVNICRSDLLWSLHRNITPSSQQMLRTLHTYVL